MPRRLIISKQKNFTKSILHVPTFQQIPPRTVLSSLARGSSSRGEQRHHNDEDVQRALHGGDGLEHLVPSDDDEEYLHPFPSFLSSYYKTLVAFSAATEYVHEKIFSLGIYPVSHGIVFYFIFLKIQKRGNFLIVYINR